MKDFENSFYQIFKDIMIVVDYNGILIDMNEMAETYFMKEKNKILNQNISKFLPEIQTQFLLEKIKKISEIGQFKFKMSLNQKDENFDFKVLNDFKNNRYIISLKPLLDEENKYSEIFNSTHIGVLVHDEVGKIINYNTYALSLFELNKEQLLGITPFDSKWKIINEDLSACRPEELPSYIARHTGVVVKNKVVGLHAEGQKIKWVTVCAYPVKNNQEKVVEVFITYNEITEIKNIQSELLQLKSALDKTFIVTELDSNFNFKNVNEKFLEATKLTKDICLDKNIIEVFPYWKEDNACNGNIPSFKHGDFIINEFSYRIKEQDQRWFRGVSCPVLNEFGELKKIYTIRMDVTAEKLANLELNKMNSWQSAILAGTTYAVIATDLNGNINTFNSTAEKMLGYKAEELINKHTPAIFHKYEEMEKKSKALSKKFKQDVKPGFETLVYETKIFGKEVGERTYVRKDKVEIPIRLCVTNVFDENGNVIGYLGIAEDITEQKQMENMLDTQRAQVIASSKLSSLGELAAGIAHEINNPLAVILGKSSQLKRGIARNEYDIKKIEQEIIKIEVMSQRISKTIKGMKLFSRNGEFDSFEFKTLSNIVDDTYNICSEKFKDNLIDVNINIDPTVDILCRPTQISQIILNILNNAYDALTESEEKRIIIKTVEDTDCFKIKIQDTGAGVPASIVEKIMEPFYTTKINGKGTGIGLSISKKIAEEHGGKLYLGTNEELTTFVLEFPLKSIKKHFIIAA